MTSKKTRHFIIVVALLLVSSAASFAGTIYGKVVDPNWYARRSEYDPWGTGMYEYSVYANAEYVSELGGYSPTNVFGDCTMRDIPAGLYTIATWDNWWRSAYVFNVNLTPAGTVSRTIRLHANMWGYPSFWDPVWRQEFGQVFTASGSSVVMLYFRVPSSGNGEVTIHDGGPGGPQIGPKRGFSSSGGPADIRLVYSGGEVPTVPGNTYYVKIRFTTAGGGAICLMDPIPDYSDPMPGGGLYIDGQPVDPRMDLGIVIFSDDDGLITNIFTRSGGSTLYPTVAGQTFRARGVNLVSAAVWVPNPSAPVVFKVLDRPGGTQIGTTKKNLPARYADPEVMVTWQPGEVPLVPGNTYYLEITRDGGGSFAIYANPYNPYPYGDAYSNGILQSNMDLAATIMEEELPGSATLPAITFTTDPAVTEANRKPASLTVTWTTNVTSDSFVEWAENVTPYTASKYDAALVSSHSMTITGLKPNTMYHIHVKSKKAGYKDAVSRDFVVCTKPDTPNLLVNGGFEEGSGASPRKPVQGWTSYGGVDIGASDGTWFGGLPPRSGSWFAQGAVNGGSSDGGMYQRVAVIPGKKYTFSAWVTTWPQENNTWKYDEWQKADGGRLIYMRLGVDPTGGTNPSSPSIEWTPRMYSHLRYTNLATTFTATSNYATVYISMKGKEVQWHLYGVDDCVLTADTVQVNPQDIKNIANNTSINFSGMVVTAVPSQAGAYYLELPDRSSGIRVESDSTVPEGSLVHVQGGLVTLPTGERAITNATLTSTASDTVPEPLMMKCKNVGGYAQGLTSAVPGSEGLQNTGLLITLTGKVTQKAADNSYIFINDGSMPGDGVKVDTTSLSAAKVPVVDSVVSVTGISTRWQDGSTVKPMLKARRDADMSEKLN